MESLIMNFCSILVCYADFRCIEILALITRPATNGWSAYLVVWFWVKDTGSAKQNRPVMRYASYIRFSFLILSETISLP